MEGLAQMKSCCTDEFWECLQSLPERVQKQANVAYQHFKQDPYYPSLHFKCIDPKWQMYSARVGRNYRAVGRMVNGDILWFWIGTHEDYNHF
jgi:hypothetical protein